MQKRLKKRWKAAILLAMCLLAIAGCGILYRQETADSTLSEESGGAESSANESAAETEDAEGEDERNALYAEQNEEEDESFTMVFAGDVFLQDNITAAYDADGIDGILSEDLLDIFKNADFVMVNEEFPFGTGGESEDNKEFTFRVDPVYVKVLQEMSVDIVSLANNHVLDYGQDVLIQTFDVLDEAGIAYVGAGETLARAMAWESFEFNGTTVGILSASRVIPEVSWDAENSVPGVFTTYDETLLVEQIRAAKLENDLVIVYVHWGIEKAEEPEEYQRQLAQAYIDAGADLVIGAHPHVLQGIEYYNGVPIVYSLGNLMFNETIERTVLLSVTVEGDEISLTLQAAAAENSFTHALEGEEEQALYAYMEEISFGVSIGSGGAVTETQ